MAPARARSVWTQPGTFAGSHAEPEQSRNFQRDRASGMTLVLSLMGRKMARPTLGRLSDLRTSALTNASDISPDRFDRGRGPKSLAESLHGSHASGLYSLLHQTNQKV